MPGSGKRGTVHCAALYIGCAAVEYRQRLRVCLEHDVSSDVHSHGTRLRFREHRGELQCRREFSVKRIAASPALTRVACNVNLHAGCLFLRIRLIVAILFSTGCAVRQPVTTNWRLTSQGTGDLLIPPGVSKPDL